MLELQDRKIKMNRGREYYRQQRMRKIKHNQNIIYHIYWDGDGYGDNKGSTKFDLPGRLSKGKVHCSCWLCAFHGQTHQDRRNLSSYNTKLDEYMYGDD